jgi:hypothetical protein
MDMKHRAVGDPGRHAGVVRTSRSVEKFDTAQLGATSEVAR